MIPPYGGTRYLEYSAIVSGDSKDAESGSHQTVVSTCFFRSVAGTSSVISVVKVLYIASALTLYGTTQMICSHFIICGQVIDIACL